LLDQLIEQLCTDSNVSALVGIPGVGKTTLVTALAQDARIRQHFCDGILWASLGRQPQVQEILSRWSQVLNCSVTELGTDSTREAWMHILRQQLGQRYVLLIIDDAWDLADAVRFQLGGHHCSHLLTTRFPNIAFSFARDDTIQLKELSQDESLHLLEKLAPHVSTRYPEEMQTLVHAVGGLPLALNLLGRHLYVQEKSQQPRRIRAALQKLQHNVQERLSLQEPRSQWKQNSSWSHDTPISLQTSIALSEKQLPTLARNAFHALSLFPCKPESFSDEAALAICDGAPEETIDLLVDYGLIESYQSGRYCLHQTIADYARLHPPLRITVERFVTFFVQFVQQCAHNEHLLEREFHAIATALNLASQHHLHRQLIQGVLGFVPFLALRRLDTLALHHLTQAQEAATALADQENLARLLLQEGKIAEYSGAFNRAKECYAAGLATVQPIHHQELTGQLQVLIGRIVLMQGDHLRAEAYLQEALAHITPQQHQVLALTLRSLGEIADWKGETRLADELYQQALIDAERGQQPELIATVLQNLGVKAARRGNYQVAEQYYQQGIAILETYPNPQRYSAFLMNLGMLAYHQQQYDQAVAYSLDCLQIARKIKDPMRLSSVLQNLGIFETKRAQYELAESYIRESLEIAQTMGHRWLINETRGVMGNLLLQQQHIAQAERLFQLMLKETREMNSPLLEAQALFGLAQTTAYHTHIEQARAFAQQSLVLCEQVDEAQQKDEISQWLQTLALHAMDAE
jgi:tetratricopeptide (TPR) repeat protein